MSRRLIAVGIFAYVAACLAYLAFYAAHLALVCGLAVGLTALATVLFGKRTPHQLARGSNLPPEPMAVNHAAVSSVPATALLEATMEGLREGVIVVDCDLRVVAANRAANDIFTLSNYSSHASADNTLIGKRLTDLTRNASVHAAFQLALEGGERHEVKVETSSSDVQGTRAFEIRVAPLRYQKSAATNGNHLPAETNGAVGVFFDITRLERLERVRQEFLSNVSHELRTPLTAIKTFIETLQDGAIDDTANNRRFLNIISRNAERMHNLINDILELSAIEAGNVRVNKSNVNLYSLVEDIITGLTPRATARRITLHNRVAPSARVFADAPRLEQMLTNLIDNAVKFNPEDSTITVTHQPLDKRDRIAVSDTGEGIATEHLTRIFERFYRVDRARSRDVGGTGLGLAIVKHLARAHGGEASVTSTLGKGSTFVIELPNNRDEEIKATAISAN